MKKVIIEITQAEKMFLLDALTSSKSPYEILAEKILITSRDVPENHAVEILPEHKQGEIDK
jgi:hypothetical protein